MSPDAPVILRSAAFDDGEALIRLLRRSWLTSWAPELPFTAVQTFAATDPAADFVRECWRAFHVAAREDRVLAMAYVDDDLLAALHVDPAEKGRGLGTRLMNWAEATIGQAHLVARLEVRGFNVAAQAFYARRGWTEERRYMASECGAPVATLELRKRLSSLGTAATTGTC